MNEPTLDECPFCGCVDETLAVESLATGVVVRCDSCGARGPHWATRLSAALAWNTRHTDAATLALARLGAAVLGSRIEQRQTLSAAAEATPNIDRRIAELLDTPPETTDDR